MVWLDRFRASRTWTPVTQVGATARISPCAWHLGVGRPARGGAKANARGHCWRRAACGHPALRRGDASSAGVTGSRESAQWCGRFLPRICHSSPRAWHRRDEERRSVASFRAIGALSRPGCPGTLRGMASYVWRPRFGHSGRLRNYGRRLGAAEAAEVSSVTTFRVAWIGSVVPCRCHACKAIVVRTRSVRCGRRIANWPSKDVIH